MPTPTRFTLVLILSACSHGRYPLSDHCDGDRFYNEDRSAVVEKDLSDLLKWEFAGNAVPWPEMAEDNVQPELGKTLHPGEGALTFINHATELLQLPQLTVITDPIYAERPSPVSWIGAKRHRHPGVPLAGLPRIDVVVISHNHYDHLDLATLAALEQAWRPTFVVPLGNKDLLVNEGLTKVVELDWWQSLPLPSGAVITLVPMQHWSARGIFDRSKALWGGYVIAASGLQVLFAGDTGYNKHFSEIAQRFGPMDLSILPIGAYAPRWFMHPQHMDPAEAVKAHRDLHSHFSVGTHFGTFQLTDEGMDDPVLELKKSLAAAHLSAKDFVAPKNGQTIFFTKAAP